MTSKSKIRRLRRELIKQMDGKCDGTDGCRFSDNTIHEVIGVLEDFQVQMILRPIKEE